ncbi:MAG TPA: choice-of-anchor B family protein [Vicinamibacterales bacterium]|nr:choice-of-anchor B family protein [Vicinamibacterales bacterium]
MSTLSRFVLCASLLAVIGFGARVGTSPATSTAASSVGFGGAVLVGDGEVFVGEAANQFRPGMVYVYRKVDGTWRQAATITKPNGAVGDNFGTTLALDGSRLFVGANADAVFIFTKQGETWTPSGQIDATSVTGVENVRFGAMAIARDWLLVGQEPPAGRGRGRGRAGQNAPPQPAGRVYAFKRAADGSYAFATTIVSPAQNTAGDSFGSDIATAGSSALIGASGHDNGAGMVFEFGVDDAGAWTRQRDFTPQGVGPGEAFGSKIAMIGPNQAVITAPGDAGGYGAAYLFRKVEQTGRRGGGGGNAGQPPAGGNFTWVESARLTQPAGARGDGFSASVAGDDKEVWVGATRAGGPGGVFVFDRRDNGFAIDAIRLLTPAGQDSAAAGTSMSMRGNVAAVGATGVNRNGGGVLIYERDNSGVWHTQPMLTPELDELPAMTGTERRCSGQGKVEMFECGSTELMAFLPPSKLTHDGHYIPMNDVWGWTDPRTKREWAIVCRRDGTTFVDMTEPTKPVPVADLPLTDGARAAAWRDAKIYKDHVYIVADGAGQHGMQVFDLTRLRTMKPQANGLPQKVGVDTLYTEIASAHNIVINEESGFAYSVGSSAGGTTCGGGLHMIDIREPKKPTFAGCFADTGTGRAGTGYSHDAQCVTYKGPDKRYKGHEICVGSNELQISIADVTDKANPKALSRATYPRVAYTHQGWFTDDQRYFFLADEIDEINGIEKTRTLIWDLADLENPKLAKEHLGTEAATDHNLFIQGDYLYLANYRAGLRILNIKDPLNPREVAYFDTAPYTNNGPGYNGAWSVYPYFRSGIIVVNSIEQGVFFVRPADRPIRR